MKKSYAEYLVTKTEDDYNKISDAFSNKRSYLTQDLIDLKKYFPRKGKILDCGCGNGRLTELITNDHKYTGVDNSVEMIRIAKQKHTDNKFLKIDSLSHLPFPKNEFDLALCLAVFHHIPSFEIRLKTLKEIKRVLKPNGKLIITVWNLVNKNEIKTQILKIKILKLMGLTKLDSGDIYYPFKNSKGEVLVNRYIHCFTQKELINVVTEAGFKIIEIGQNERGKRVKNSNIVLIASN